MHFHESCFSPRVVDATVCVETTFFSFSRTRLHLHIFMNKWHRTSHGRLISRLKLAPENAPHHASVC